MDLGLTGKIALVTGCDQRRRPRDRAQSGRRRRNNCRQLPLFRGGCGRLVGEITAKGGKAKAYEADVADFAAVKTMVEQIVKDFGGLNILINNAGLALRQRFMETKPEDWHRQIDACLYGAIHCCHAAAPHLDAAKNGRIVSVIGDSSRVGESGLAIVAAARAGMSRIDEIAGAGIRPLRHDRKHRLARTGGNAARQGMGRRQPRKTNQALSAAPPWRAVAMSRRW